MLRFRGLVFWLSAAMAILTLPASGDSSGTRAPLGSLRLMTDQEQERWRRLLPATDDAWLLELFASDLIFYTNKEVPQAYQHAGGLYTPARNLSANRNEPYGNPNIEFPWGAPAGTHRSPNAHAVRFVHLTGPIRWWREKLSSVRAPTEWRGYGWEYAMGTTFGEVLLLNDEQGKLWTYEVRTRTKGEDRWLVNVYRPFLTRDELRSWLAAHAPAVDVGPPRPMLVRLVTAQPGLVTFDRVAAVDELPVLPGQVVRRLLGQPFRLANGAEWVRTGNTPGYAPTTRARFSIVPVDYDGAFLRLTSRSCMACHDDARRDAGDFDRTRDWQGRVRGADKIISFHPFEPASISGDGTPQEPRLRQALTEAGLLKHWKE
jgi:hypothetical protein